MKLRLLFVVVVGSLCLAVVWYLGTIWGQTTIPHSIPPPVEVDAEAKYQSKINISQPEEEEKVDTRPSRFLYLVQTESCISYRLKSPRAIGDASACQCDVLVLSYKKVCNVTPPAHVEYIFDPSTTWNSGRNLLFQTARQRNEKYLYYTFMDDDIVLRTRTKKNPWRMNEEFIRRIEPVIGIVEIDNGQCLPWVLEGRKLQGCSSKVTPEYLPIALFDSAFNSFHYQAIDYLLPYPVKFDNVSWWFNGWFVKAKAEAMFPGQVVVHTRLSILNKKHRPYPRDMGNRRIWDIILDDIEASLPRKYRNITVLREWREQNRLHAKLSSTLCRPPVPPHMPIQPFAYLEDSNQITYKLYMLPKS